MEVDIPAKYDLGYSDKDVVNVGWKSHEQNRIISAWLVPVLGIISTAMQCIVWKF